MHFQLFRVPAFDSNGNLLSIEQLKNELKNRVVAESNDLSRYPVGVVTSEHRDKWASLYSRLKGSFHFIKYKKIFPRKFFLSDKEFDTF